MLNRKWILLFFWGYLIFAFPLMAQEAAEDSSLFWEELSHLEKAGQYATIHKKLSQRIESEGLRPKLGCKLVENGLMNAFAHEKFTIFFIRNQGFEETPPDSAIISEIVRLRHPERLLHKLISTYPNCVCAHKLLGDYYRLQIQEYADTEILDINKIKPIEEKIFQYYSRAIQLGLDDREVNQWMGNYFQNRNNLQNAEKFYLKNSKPGFEDAISLRNLAEIYFIRKEYTKSYNYIKKAIELFDPSNVYLTYDAMLLAAQDVLALGDTVLFYRYVNDASNLIPDDQNAYLTLIDFYESQSDTAELRHTITNMLLKNPFDREGYCALERYVIGFGDKAFADSLFTDLQVKYENWDEALGNIYWSKGNLAFQAGKLTEASKLWEISRSYFKKVLPENHPNFKKIGKDFTKKTKY